MDLIDELIRIFKPRKRVVYVHPDDFDSVYAAAQLDPILSEYCTFEKSDVVKPGTISVMPLSNI